MASTTLTVRLRPELKDRLGKLAERTRRTKSFLAGEAMRRIRKTIKSAAKKK